ncbi:arylamine N-acetyltransferase [Saccharopolyspora sp. HNM0983]|uniref:Arylamine N-acetyltransferase n=1 Tax=Saccharopolyspora montiporae TaxID=2781240 RepID=A0A929BD03_9PSEU|nr:arylamine N-acetyltransferase [Saccharopolyspora sp. HNM0983]MBE9375252.1 arylamine N-acetyltransferase [Saccharopolyspora sp. HNM0983]
MTAPTASALDLPAYLERIGFPGPPDAPDLGTLSALQRGHLMSIPFENLDVVGGSVPSLALADLQDKLVRGGRGGYCFEHNLLLAAVLERVGFGVRLLTGRVLVGTDDPASRPRTHAALLVDVPGEDTRFLTDVGFGSIGAPIEPLPFTAGAERAAGTRRHRLSRWPGADGYDSWVLEARAGDRWVPQYALSAEPAARIDLDVANWYIATHPRSPFRDRPAVQRTEPGVHRSLSGRELTITDEHTGTARTRELTDEQEVRRVLREEMGLPDGVR